MTVGPVRRWLGARRLRTWIVVAVLGHVALLAIVVLTRDQGCFYPGAPFGQDGPHPLAIVWAGVALTAWSSGVAACTAWRRPAARWPAAGMAVLPILTNVVLAVAALRMPIEICGD